MSNQKKQVTSAQNSMLKSNTFWLKLAKAERSHAYKNKNKCLDAGDSYGANVYTVRIKALDLYIKSLQKKEVI